MIVSGSQVTMAAAHKSQTLMQVEERFVWRDAGVNRDGAANRGAAGSLTAEIAPAPSTVDMAASAAPTLNIETLNIDLSRAGSLLAKHRLSQTLDTSLPADPRAERDLKILQATLKGITGRDFGFKPLTINAPTDFATPMPSFAQPASGRELVYQRETLIQEQESVAFAAKGLVQTQDGREIAFDISLTMSRQFTQVAMSETSIFSAGPTSLIDPIVINFDGKGAELIPKHLHFDLDMDGELDQIAQLGSGSGYLVWDKNGDGQVNDGSELFGPQSGQGFTELAALDANGNGFIDAGDPLFSQLRLWVQRDDGSSQLLALGDKDVGAIYVGHVTTPFTMTDSAGNRLGQMANTGIYLKESGEVGLVQEVLLAKA